MSEKMSNTPENTEQTRSTVPAEIIDFETKLADQQEALAAAQANVDELNFRSSAEDHVRAKGELRDAKATYSETMANMNDQWLQHGGERLEDARTAVEELDFGSDASERAAAQTELRDAENAWSESYSSANAEATSPEDQIDQSAAAGLDKINQSADQHMAAIDDHAEQASAEIRQSADPVAEAAAETTEAPKKFDPEQAAEEAKQRLHEAADEKADAAFDKLKAKAEAMTKAQDEGEKHFMEAVRKASSESNQSAAESKEEPSEAVEAAKQALDYQERPDEATDDSPESDTESSEEFVDAESNEETAAESAEAEPTEDSAEFVDDTPTEEAETVATEDTVEDSTETETETSDEAADGEFVPVDDETEDSQETGEKAKGRFGRMKSFLKNMRHKAGVATVVAYNTTMDGFGKLGKPMTPRLEGELEDSYEDRSKVRGLAMVALAATAYAAYNRLSGGDSGEGFFGAGDGGSESILGDNNDLGGGEQADGADSAESADIADFDHDNTPESDGWSSEALTADNGEGWYQTFEDMNIPRSEWDDLLNKAGPQLETEGWAYKMEDGSYGISRPGAVPAEILDIIESNR